MKKLLLTAAVIFTLLFSLSCEKEEVRPTLSDYTITWEYTGVPGYYRWEIKYHDVSKWETNDIFQDDKFQSHAFYSVRTAQFNVSLAQFRTNILDGQSVNIPIRKYWDKDDSRISDNFVGEYRQVDNDTYELIYKLKTINQL